MPHLRTWLAFSFASGQSSGVPMALQHIRQHVNPWRVASSADVQQTHCRRESQQISVERKRLFEPPSSNFVPRSMRRLSQYPHFLPIALPHHSASGPAGLFLRRVRRRLAGSRSFTERVTGSWEESQWSRAHASYSGAYNFFVAGRERPFKHAIALCSGAWPGGCGKDRARAHAVGREKVDYKP